jgi:hypothetical protein
MGHRRILQAISVTTLGVALACAPMAVASASHHKAKHHKTKHHTSKTASKKGSDPSNSICLAINSAQSSSASIAPALEKAFAGGTTSTFAGAKQAMLSAMNTALKEEGQAEADLRSAPSNVQAAMKDLFAFEGTFKAAISNASSLTQLETSMASLGTSPKLQTDSTTLTNYVTSLCGATTTTTVAIP